MMINFQEKWLSSPSLDAMWPGKLPRLIQEALGCSGRAEGQFEYCDDRLLVQRILLALMWWTPLIYTMPVCLKHVFFPLNRYCKAKSLNELVCFWKNVRLLFSSFSPSHINSFWYLHCCLVFWDHYHFCSKSHMDPPLWTTTASSKLNDLRERPPMAAISKNLCQTSS